MAVKNFMVLQKNRNQVRHAEVLSPALGPSNPHGDSNPDTERRLITNECDLDEKTGLTIMANGKVNQNEIPLHKKLQRIELNLFRQGSQDVEDMATDYVSGPLQADHNTQVVV